MYPFSWSIFSLIQLCHFRPYFHYVFIFIMERCLGIFDVWVFLIFGYFRCLVGISDVQVFPNVFENVFKIVKCLIIFNYCS